MALLVLVAACTPSGTDSPDRPDAATQPDGSLAVDAAIGVDARPLDAPPLVDASPPADAPPPVACDTVTTDRVVVNGDVVSTCLATDADVDTYRFVAPATDAAGGTLRFRIDYSSTQCQINFKAWIDADAQYTWASSNLSFSNPTPAQLDHHFIGLVAPGSAYTLRVMKRLAFAGSCDYVLTTSYVALDDPYEPNQVLADFKPITVGQTVSTYMACISPDRAVYPGDCEDHYTVSLPVGNYNLTWSMSSGPNINPCLSVYCRDTSVTPAVVTHDEFNCQAATFSHSFNSVFNITRASQCFVHLHGSSRGGMYGAYTSATLPGAMQGTTTRYNVRIVQTP